MTRPWSTTTTWSARSSASSMRCVVSTTATPSSRSSRTRSQTACRVCGSMPALGSSRNTTSGRPTIAAASASRWRWPPESRRTVVRGERPEPEALGELAQVPRVGVHRGDVREHLVRLDARRQPAVLQHHADARAQVAGVASAGRGPARARVPPSGSRRPSQHSIVVVLPAPFGPEDRGHLAVVGDEVEPVDDGAAAVALDEPGDLERGGVGHEREV